MGNGASAPRPFGIYWQKFTLTQWNMWATYFPVRPLLRFRATEAATWWCDLSCCRLWRCLSQLEMWKESITLSWSVGRRTVASSISNHPPGCTVLGQLCWPSPLGARTWSRTPPLFSRFPSPHHNWERARRRRAWRNLRPLWKFPTHILFLTILHLHLQIHLPHLQSTPRCYTPFTSSKRLLQTWSLPKSLLFSNPHKALAAQNRTRTCSSTVVAMTACVVKAPATSSFAMTDWHHCYSNIRLFCTCIFILDNISIRKLLVYTKASSRHVELLLCSCHLSWCYLLLVLLFRS